VKKNKSKYLATQLSATFVGFISVFLVIFVIKNMFPSILFEMSLFKVALIIITFIIIMIGSMILWGKILVLFGALTKEEAEGVSLFKTLGR
jgi:hypothetical protein